MPKKKSPSYALVGYGVSNRAMCNYLIKNGVYPVVRCKEKCALPLGVTGVFGDGYLNACEEIVFRSPGIRADKIKGNGEIHTEAEYALNKLRSYKIGVTGSDGKTTTSTLIYRMLMCGGKNTFLCGNIGKPVIDICEMAGENDVAVAELSSFQLMGGKIGLNIGAITCISENHLDYHTDMAEYIDAKRNITRGADICVLNYDDPCVRNMGKAGDRYFSLCDLSSLVGDGNTYIYLRDGNIYYNGERLFSTQDVCLKGEFNLQNVLCAIGCAYPLVGTEACHRVAREFCGVSHRQEVIDTVGGVTFVCSAIDSTPSRTEKTLSLFAKEKTVAILGGYDKNLSYESLEKPLKSLRGVILCGENKDKIAKAIKRRAVTVATLEEAVKVAYNMARQGDTVVLSPASASFDMFKSYKEKAECFKCAVLRLKREEQAPPLQ